VRALSGRLWISWRVQSGIRSPVRRGRGSERPTREKMEDLEGVEDNLTGCIFALARPTIGTVIGTGRIHPDFNRPVSDRRPAMHNGMVGPSFREPLSS
jgi:hypothetical protein